MTRMCLETAFYRELDREGRLKVPWATLVDYLKEHHNLGPSHVAV